MAIEDAKTDRATSGDPACKILQAAFSGVARLMTVCLRVTTVCALTVAVGALAAQRPNILFIMSDDHAAHAISAYGSLVNRTPNLDRLANEGIRFNYCFAVNSICTPSRATILT